MLKKYFLVLFCAAFTSATLNDYKCKGLVLLQSAKELSTGKAINLTLAGQIEFRRFLGDALDNCRNAYRISIGSNCPRKAWLNQFTHACCTEDRTFLYLSINNVKLSVQGAVTFLNLLHTRIDDSFEFTTEINPVDDMILIYNIHHNDAPTVIRTFDQTEYPTLQQLLYRYRDFCMLENTEATESQACPRVYTCCGFEFCCDQGDQLLYVRLGRITLTRNDVDILTSAMSRVSFL